MYVHYKISSEYRQKRRLCVQNRSAGCVLSCRPTNTSKQQEVSLVCFRKQSLSVMSTSLRSEHSPSGIYLFGAHYDRLPPSSGDFGYSLPRRLVSSSPRPPSSTLPLITLDLVGFILNRKKSEFTFGSGESLIPRIQGLGDSSTCMRDILSISTLISTSVPVHGLTQLGFRSHPSGSSVPEAITAPLSIFRSDKSVYRTV